MSTFVMGDIHGAYKALVQCLERSGFNKETDTLIQLGDEDGFDEQPMDEFDIKVRQLPYIQTLEGKILYGEYGNHYIIYGNHNDKWLVRKDIFEETYQLLTEPYTS